MENKATAFDVVVASDGGLRHVDSVCSASFRFQMWLSVCMRTGQCRDDGLWATPRTAQMRATTYNVSQAISAYRYDWCAVCVSPHMGCPALTPFFVACSIACLLSASSDFLSSRHSSANIHVPFLSFARPRFVVVVSHTRYCRLHLACRPGPIVMHLLLPIKLMT